MLCTPNAGSMESVQWLVERRALFPGSGSGGSAPRRWVQHTGALMARLEAEHEEWHCLAIAVGWRAYICQAESELSTKLLCLN